MKDPEVLRDEFIENLKDSFVSGFADGYKQGLMEATKWIPVTERLPEDEEMKLVTCRTKKGILNVNRAYYMDGAWHGSGTMSGVIAWMELPEPYREDADE